MKKKEKWIMDCDIEELLQIILQYLQELDDAMQSASELNKPKVSEYISDSYDKLEKLYRQFQKTGKASRWDRNSARMLIKETNKMIVVELVIPTDYA